jgi:hypothetical protein
MPRMTETDKHVFLKEAHVGVITSQRHAIFRTRLVAL